MPRSDLDIHFNKIDKLLKEIESLVPNENVSLVQFRSDLAGLLVVAIAATYENCVKEILYEHANQYHIAFGDFAYRNFERLNSKIKVNNLEDYCKLYNDSIFNEFRKNIKTKKSLILQKTRKNIVQSYEQILNWRHDYAHALISNITIEDAAAMHLLGKRVIYIFDNAFSQFSPSRSN